MTYNPKKQNILYDPDNNDGSLSHYHHFMFGYLLPVYMDVKAKQLDKTHNIFLQNVRSTSMNQKVKEIGFNVWGQPKVHWNTPLIRSAVKGFDGSDHPVDKKAINNTIGRYLIKKDKSVTKEPYILLLDRGKRQPKLRKKFVNTFGSERRTIVNIETVERVLSEYANIIRIDTANLSLNQQIKLFANAWMVFSQHGAALSNLIFANRCKFMFEIVSDRRMEQYNWFQNLCEAKNIARYRIHTMRDFCICDIEEVRNIMEYLKSNNYIPTPITES